MGARTEVEYQEQVRLVSDLGREKEDLGDVLSRLVSAVDGLRNDKSNAQFENVDRANNSARAILARLRIR